MSNIIPFSFLFFSAPIEKHVSQLVCRITLVRTFHVGSLWILISTAQIADEKNIRVWISHIASMVEQYVESGWLCGKWSAVSQFEHEAVNKHRLLSVGYE